MILERVSPDFRAGAGFVVCLDRQHLNLFQSCHYLSKEENDFFRRVGLHLEDYSAKTTKGELKSEGTAGYASLTFPNRLRFFLNGGAGKERFNGKTFSGVWFKGTSWLWVELPLFQPWISFSRGREVV